MSDKTPERPVTPPRPPATASDGPLPTAAAAHTTEPATGEPPLLEEQIVDGAAPSHGSQSPPPEAPGAAAGKRNVPPRKRPARRRWSGPLLCVLLLVVAAFFAWQWWANLQQQQRGWRNAVAALERQQAQLGQQLQDEMAAAQSALAARVTELETALQDAAARTAAVDDAPAMLNQALLDEAITLAVLAQQQLLLTGDVNSARRLLAVADEVLARATEPAFVAAREALAADRQQLAAADHLDLTALILQLNGLQAQVPALVVPRHEQVRAGERQPQPVGDGFWERLWARLPVRVRDHGSNVPLPLDADSQQLVRLNLESALQEARLALLQGRGVVFENALVRADGLLQQWFVESDPAVIAARDTLAELQAVPVARAMPEIDQGLSLMRQLRETRPSREAR